MQKFKQGLEIWGLQLRTGANSFLGSFTHSNTADRQYTLPNASGTIALTDSPQAFNQRILIMKQDMMNRKSGLDEEIANLQGKKVDHTTGTEMLDGGVQEKKVLDKESQC